MSVPGISQASHSPLACGELTEQLARNAGKSIQMFGDVQACYVLSCLITNNFASSLGWAVGLGANNCHFLNPDCFFRWMIRLHFFFPLEAFWGCTWISPVWERKSTGNINKRDCKSINYAQKNCTIYSENRKNNWIRKVTKVELFFVKHWDVLLISHEKLLFWATEEKMADTVAYTYMGRKTNSRSSYRHKKKKSQNGLIRKK